MAGGDARGSRQSGVNTATTLLVAVWLMAGVASASGGARADLGASADAACTTQLNTANPANGKLTMLTLGTADGMHWAEGAAAVISATGVFTGLPPTSGSIKVEFAQSGVTGHTEQVKDYYVCDRHTGCNPMDGIALFLAADKNGTAFTVAMPVTLPTPDPSGTSVFTAALTGVGNQGVDFGGSVIYDLQQKRAGCGGCAASVADCELCPGVGTKELCGGNGGCLWQTKPTYCNCTSPKGGRDCTSCASGFYDPPTCGQCPGLLPGTDTVCSGTGTCNASTGCVCDTRYAGTDCSDCASGYFGYMCAPDFSGKGVEVAARIASYIALITALLSLAVRSCKRVPNHPGWMGAEANPMYVLLWLQSASAVGMLSMPGTMLPDIVYQFAQGIGWSNGILRLVWLQRIVNHIVKEDEQVFDQHFAFDPLSTSGNSSDVADVGLGLHPRGALETYWRDQLSVSVTGQWLYVVLYSVVVAAATAIAYGCVIAYLCTKCGRSRVQSSRSRVRELFGELPNLAIRAGVAVAVGLMYFSAVALLTVRGTTTVGSKLMNVLGMLFAAVIAFAIPAFVAYQLCTRSSLVGASRRKRSLAQRLLHEVSVPDIDAGDFTDIQKEKSSSSAAQAAAADGSGSESSSDSDSSSSSDDEESVRRDTRATDATDYTTNTEATESSPIIAPTAKADLDEEFLQVAGPLFGLFVPRWRTFCMLCLTFGVRFFEAGAVSVLRSNLTVQLSILCGINAVAAVFLAAARPTTTTAELYAVMGTRVAALVLFGLCFIFEYVAGARQAIGIVVVVLEFVGLAGCIFVFGAQTVVNYRAPPRKYSE